MTPIDDHPDPTRRRLLAGAVALPSLAACTGTPLVHTAGSGDARLSTLAPIVFVHGNGDNAALWTTTIWRFESNGWPRERLHAFDVRYPLARDDDTREQPGRTSTEENRRALADAVARVREATGAPRVTLVGNSRGGYAIRSFLAAGGAGQVDAVVLGGVPNHGVYADPARGPNNEFNGAGVFLSALNAPRGPQGLEVPDGVRVLTLRSDGNDKFAQPEGTWIGQRGVPTHVTAEGPALKGATNLVLPGVDHRETSFSPQAFDATWRFLVGAAPSTTGIVAERSVVLDGMASGLGLDNRQGSFANNLPLVGATVEVHAVDPATGARLGEPRHRKTIGPDGRWGPFTTTADTWLEFVVSGAGHATTHVYRSPFPRSSRVVNLRAERITDADREGGALAVVTLTRPRGYFGIPRNRIVLDGASPPAGIPPGVAGLSVARARVTDRVGRTVVGSFDDERIAGLAWPLAEGHVVLLELTG